MSIRNPYPTARACRLVGVDPAPAATYALIDDVPSHVLIDLIKIGAAERSEAQNDGPSIGDLLKFFRSVRGEVLYFGYIVLPPRPDCRVTISGFVFTAANTADREKVINRFHDADEFNVVRGKIRAWWD